MMGCNKIRFLVLFLLLGVSMIACANEERKDFCLVFWGTKPGLSIDILDKTDYLECTERFPDFVKIDFSEFERFDSDSQVFVLKDKIDDDRYRWIGSYEQFYISLVIDNRIILNGVNGHRALSARKLPEIGPFKQFISLVKRKYLVISEELFFDEIFMHRRSLDTNLKKILTSKMH